MTEPTTRRARVAPGHARVEPFLPPESELQQVQQAARAQGYRAGEAQGREQFLARASELLGALEAALQALESERESCMRNAEADVAALALAVAERVIATRLEQDPASLAPWVSQALDELSGDGTVTVHLHPEVLDAVAPALQDDASTRRLQLVKDAGLEIGACRLHTRHEQLDASMAQRLGVVAAAFLAALARPVAGDAGS